MVNPNAADVVLRNAIDTEPKRTIVLRRRKMNWGGLHTFLAVARAGTLTEAADSLGLNPSTLHRRVARLEEDQGVRLFEKGPGGYRLTLVGEALLPHAEAAEEAVLAASRVVRGHDRDPVGEVRLTMTNDLLGLVAPLLLAFRDDHPRITVVLTAGDRVLDLGRQADVALRLGPTPAASTVGRKIAPVAWARYGSAGDAPWMGYVAMARVPEPTAPPMLCVDTVSAMSAVLGCVRGQGWLPCFVGDGALPRLCDPIELGDHFWVLVHADLRRAARVRALIDFLAPRLEDCRARFAGEWTATGDLSTGPERSGKRPTGGGRRQRRGRADEPG